MLLFIYKMLFLGITQCLHNGSFFVNSIYCSEPLPFCNTIRKRIIIKKKFIIMLSCFLCKSFIFNCFCIHLFIARALRYFHPLGPPYFFLFSSFRFFHRVSLAVSSYKSNIKFKFISSFIILFCCIFRLHQLFILGFYLGKLVDLCIFFIFVYSIFITIYSKFELYFIFSRLIFVLYTLHFCAFFVSYSFLIHSVVQGFLCF